MGLFGISMPVLYGEGLLKAFRRIQLEILQTTQDHSLFAWIDLEPSYGLLAPSPDAFRYSSRVARGDGPAKYNPWHMTNYGLEVTLPLIGVGEKSSIGFGSFDEHACDNTGPAVCNSTKKHLNAKGTPLQTFQATLPKARLSCVLYEPDGSSRNIAVNLIFAGQALDGRPIFLRKSQSSFTFWTTNENVIFNPSIIS